MDHLGRDGLEGAEGAGSQSVAGAEPMGTLDAADRRSAGDGGVPRGRGRDLPDGPAGERRRRRTRRRPRPRRRPRSRPKKSSKKKFDQAQAAHGVAEARAREGRRRGSRAGRHDPARRRLRPARPPARADRPPGRRRHRRLLGLLLHARTASLGKDAQYRSTKVEVAKQGKATITLRYGVYKDGDKAGEPSGTKRVRFRLDGGTMTALDTVPAAEDRFQRSGN